MSLDTWKQEFYPVAASDVTGGDVQATEHSLRKWLGLRPGNLLKHNVVLAGVILHNEDAEEFNFLDADSSEFLIVNGGSCALCELHLNCDRDDCGSCPLAEYLGGPCDKYDGPYDHFANTQDPEPMISALQETLKLVQER